MFKLNRGNKFFGTRLTFATLIAISLGEAALLSDASANPPRGPNYNPTPAPSYQRGNGHRPPPMPTHDTRPRTNPNGRPVPVPAVRRPGDRPPPIPNVRVPSRVRGRPVPVQPARSNDQYDRAAHGVLRDAIQGARCEAMGDILRRLANALLKASSETAPAGVLNSNPNQVITYQATGEPALRITMRNRAFWENIWQRVGDAYRACEVGCFDDGYAVGQMSAISYCAASMGVDGLDGVGFLAQPPLPLCENSVFIGCQKGYVDGAYDYAGCANYTVDRFESVFAEQVSQDCHMGNAGY